MKNYKLIKIKQHFSNNTLADVKGEVRNELSKLGHLIKPGASIAVAAGSRGIKNLALLVSEVAEFVISKNAFPFIVPAMGSHGGATAEGQASILADYGISEKMLGVPVRSSMEVVELPAADSPVPVYMDRFAFESDGIILINRIKQHTDYHATYESGMVKMSVIGLGKEKQASAIHMHGVYGLSVLIPVAAKHIFATGKILGGIAIVENAYDETMLVKALQTKEFFDAEPALLEIATRNMPSLPADDIDVLIIDQLGKNISGVGIDPNIIGRTRIIAQKEPDKPIIKAILVLDLTRETHGNAMGIGLADVITRKLYDKIDFPVTYTNIITSSFLERGKVPVVAETDREGFNIALRSCGYLIKGDEKIVRIKNTLNMGEVYVSQAVLKEIRESKRIEILKENVNLFEGENDIAPF
jgi:hypothetical protein